MGVLGSVPATEQAQSRGGPRRPQEGPLDSVAESATGCAPHMVLVLLLACSSPTLPSEASPLAGGNCYQQQWVFLVLRGSADSPGLSTVHTTGSEVPYSTCATPGTGSTCVCVCVCHFVDRIRPLGHSWQMRDSVHWGSSTSEPLHYSMSQWKLLF